MAPYGAFTVGANYSFEHVGDTEKVTDDLENIITFTKSTFEKYFENLGEVIATYCNPLIMDEANYNVYLIVQNISPTLEEIKAYAKITNKNYIYAKKALVHGKILLVSGNAYGVSEALKILNSFQVKYEIEPHYPYDKYPIAADAIKKQEI